MPLSIVIPVSNADIHRLESTISAIEFFGGLQKHSVFFCCAPSVQAEVSITAGRIRAICDQTFIESLPREPEPRGRFGAFNMIFRDSVEILAKRGNANPWLWWELDTVPIRAGWADRLELEYHQRGMPFCGVRRKATEVMRDRDGNALSDKDPDAQGDYMVAVGIYPPNFKDFSTLYKYPSPSGAMPSDVTIRHEINKWLHNTPLIAHHWSTHNYRRNAQGQIECDDLKRQENFPSYAGVVSEMAFVLHGVKDDSLAKLVMSEAAPLRELAISPTATISSSGQVEIGALKAENDALKAQNDELRRDIQKLNEQWSRKENSYAEEIETLKEKLAGFSDDHKSEGKITPDTSNVTGSSQVTISEAEITTKPLPPLEAVILKLKEAGKKIRLDQMAADFGVPAKSLRSLVSQPNSGINLTKGGLAWMSLAA